MEPSFVKYGPDSHKKCPHQSVSIIIYDSLKNYKEDHKIIIVDAKSGKQISFRELWQLTAKVSINLTKWGLGKDDCVAIISENSWQNIVISLSMLMIGATTTRLNPDFTQAELKHFLSASPPKLLCCSSKVLGGILKVKDDCGFSEILVLDKNIKDNIEDKVKLFEKLLLNVDETETARFRPVTVSPEKSVAIITCSSGTTGLPKGVMLTSANLYQQIKFYGNSEVFDLNDQEVILAYLPMYHIYGIIVLLGGLLFHSKLVVMEKFIPEKFLKHIQDHKVTKLFGVPSILMFLKNTTLLNNYDLSSVQHITNGVGPVDKDVQKWIANKFNLKTIQQLYGMTEAGGIVTATPKKSENLASVGKIVGSHKMKVSDLKTGKALGPREIGEICIGGSSACIMMGYFKNEEATKAAFDSKGFIKTGDLGYYDEKDYFYIVGRIKEIIKCKGFQVSPVELEDLLINHPAVKDVGIIGVPHERVGEAPLAFVVKQPQSNVTEEDICRYVAENISGHKHLYGGVRFVDEIPKTASGKVMRRKLKELLARSP